MTSVANYLRPAARWLVALALVFHVAWLPVHLLTVAHSDPGQAHVSQHGHGHGDDDTHDHGDTDQHHFASDHESKFLSKRHALLFAPTLVTWQVTVLTPPLSVAIERPVHADPAPPPADFPPPSGPRAPPLA